LTAPAAAAGRLSAAGIQVKPAQKFWEALGRDDQHDDDLPAVTAFVAAAAVLAQIIRAAVFVGLEAGAGQRVQQQVELGVEKLSPAAHEQLEQLVRATA
jgi:hypothetical protein